MSSSWKGQQRSMILPTYPGKIPQTSPNPQKERNPFTNCWWNVRGIFQGYVGEVLEPILYPGTLYMRYFSGRKNWDPFLQSHKKNNYHILPEIGKMNRNRQEPLKNIRYHWLTVILWKLSLNRRDPQKGGGGSEGKLAVWLNTPGT